MITKTFNNNNNNKVFTAGDRLNIEYTNVHFFSSLHRFSVQLLDILVHGTADDYTKVRECSLEALDRFQKDRLSCNNCTLVDMMEENIYSLATQLPGKIMNPGFREYL